MGNMLTRSDRTKYTVYSDAGSAIVKEPRGWEKDGKELRRDKKYLGVSPSFTNNSLQFYGNGRDLLKNLYETSGIKSNAILERSDRNENTDVFEAVYSAKFDYSTFKQSKNFVSMKLDESRFFKTIENRMRERYELDRLTDIFGNPIPPLQYINFNFQGRDIFRETKFDDAEVARINYKGTALYNALDDVQVPLTLVYRSDDNFVAPVGSQLDTSGYVDLFTARIARAFFPEVIYSAGAVYYLTAPNDKTINVTIQLEGRVKFNTPGGADGTVRFYHDVVHANGSGDLVNTDTVQLLSLSSTVSPSNPNYLQEGVWKNFAINYTTSIDLITDDCLGLRCSPFFSGSYSADNQFQMEFTKRYVLADEDDLGETTECTGITFDTVMHRLLLIITGKDCFTSSLFGTGGYWEALLVTSGFKIRQFPDKPITVSLEECIDAAMTIDDVALVVQDETVRLERKDYVFDKTDISIDLGKVNNIEREIEKDLHFSSIEIGYDFNGEYEEVNGLDEYNIKNTYNTCISEVDNPHKSISKLRADAYGMTIAQQSPYVTFPKKDTKYDKELFFVDCKKSGSFYAQRTWEDDFADEPTGIYSPETAFNLRLSPFNCLLRKGKYLSAGLLKYPTEKITYSSTQGNSQLVTEYPEQANVQNNVLASPYCLPETVTFSKNISLAQFSQIVNNPYKMVKYTNEYNKPEYGFVMSVQPNGEGKFELLKANV